MTQSSLMTVADIAKASGLSAAIVKGLVSDLEPAVVNRSGRVKMWDLDDVRKVVREKNASVLKFLGYTVDPSESYDVPLNLAAEDSATV